MLQFIIDIKTFLPIKYAILLGIMFLLAVGLLITSTSSALGFHFKGFVFCMIGFVFVFGDAYFIS